MGRERWRSTASLLIVLAAFALSCRRADAQDTALPDEIPRDRKALLEAVHRYPLFAGGALIHDTYGGRLYRFDQRAIEVARTKVPKEVPLATHTELVLSRDQSRVLVLHHADKWKWRAQSRTLLFDARTLKQIVEWPLGRCDDVRGEAALPAVIDTLTLLCQDSRSPDNPKQKATLAVVALDLSAAKVVSWSALGGERHGQWFGPMFFGYYYDTDAVAVESTGKECPTDLDQASNTPAEVVSYPWRVIVLERSKGEHKGEVWFLDTFGAAPRRVGTLKEPPTSAMICGADRKVLVVRERLGEAYSPTGSIVETFDLASGQRVR